MSEETVSSGATTVESKTKQVIPVGKRLLIRQDEPEDKMGKGGIIDAPDSAKNPPPRGEVLDSGLPSVRMLFPKGTVVLFSEYAGADVSEEFDDGRIYKIIEEEDILAIVQ